MEDDSKRSSGTRRYAPLSDSEPGIRIEMSDKRDTNVSDNMHSLPKLLSPKRFGTIGAGCHECSTCDGENVNGLSEIRTRNPRNIEMEIKGPTPSGIGAEGCSTCKADDYEDGEYLPGGSDSLINRRYNSEPEFKSYSRHGSRDHLNTYAASHWGNSPVDSYATHNGNSPVGLDAHDRDRTYSVESEGHFHVGSEIHAHKPNGIPGTDTLSPGCPTQNAVSVVNCPSCDTEIDYFNYSPTGYVKPSPSVDRNDIETGWPHPEDASDHGKKINLLGGRPHSWANKMEIRMSTAHLNNKKSPVPKSKSASTLRPKPVKSVPPISLFGLSFVVFLICFAVSGYFAGPGDLELFTTMKYSNGLCVLWLVVWGINRKHIAAILMAYTLGVILSSASMNNHLSVTLEIMILSCDLLQILLCSTILLTWRRKELGVPDAKNILTFRIYFSFALVAAIGTPIILSTLFTLAAYDSKGEQLKSFYATNVHSSFKNDGEGHIMFFIFWALSTSVGTITMLWVGMVSLATVRGFMASNHLYSRSKNGPVCNVSWNIVHVRNIVHVLNTKISENYVEILWKGAVLVVIAIGNFISTFSAVSSLCELDSRMGVMFMLGVVFVAWSYPPIVSGFFQLYCMSAMSSTLMFVERRCEYQHFRNNLLRLFVDQLTLILASFFIVITVYQNQRIYMELSKEHDKLCASLADAKKMQDRNKLFAVISHEIKTPLNLIQGFSKEIEDYKPDVPSEAKAIAKHISEASSHILDILSELLELFRLKSDNYWTIRCSPMDLHAFWATTCEKVVSLGDQNRVHVDFSIAEGVPHWIACDRRRLTQVLLNLASYAVQGNNSPTSSEGRELDYKRHRGGKVGSNSKHRANVNLMLQYLPAHKSINMRISDKGELIFTQYIEEFRKVFPGRGGKLNGNDKHNDHEILFGSTMGLYIAAEIVKKMGGDVTIASALGHGTEINIMIPVTRCSSRERKPTPIELKAPPSISSHVNILIVEDSAVNRNLLTRMLEHMGYTSISQASDGLEALTLVKRARQHFDIVLLDLSMPQMDGTGFLTSLKDNGRPSSLMNTSIIITSGHVSDDTWCLLESLGTDGRVDKPYKQEQVATAIETVLRKKNSFRKLPL